MSEPIDYSDFIEEILQMLQRVGASHDDHRQLSSNIHKKLLQMVSSANDRLADANKQRMLNERLLMSLIAELAASKAVDAAAVAKRFQASVKAQPFLFDEPHRVQAKFLAAHLSHSGFPDAVPQPRSAGPVLIVDNDTGDS